MSKFLTNKNYLSLILISIPFLSFANANLHSFDFIFFSSLFFILFFVVIAIFLLAKFLSLFQKKLDYKISSFILSFIFFALFYLFPLFKDLLIYTAPIYNAEISLIFSIIFLILFLFLFFDQRYKFFKHFILIYLSFCFIASLGIFIFNTTIFLSGKIPNDNTVFIEEKGIQNLQKNKKTNMYFVIVDEAIPLDKFDKYFKTNYFSSFKSKWEKQGFDYIKNTNSPYAFTVQSLTSLFYLDYPLTEKNYKKYILTNIFPIILLKKNANKIPLIKNLKKIDYKFKWLGNSHYNCEMINLDFCLDAAKKPQKKTLVASYVTAAFLHRSPLIRIYTKINSILGISDPEILYDNKANDSLNEFVNRMKNFKIDNQGYFFLIHHLMPSPPFIFNSDCSIKKGLDIMTDKEIGELNISSEEDKTKHIKGYKENYECMLKRVDEFISFINKNDPEANIIITSDHGHTIYDIFYIRFDTFTVVKTNKACKQNVPPNNLNIPNGVRLLLGCTVDQKINFLENKIYWVDFVRGHFSVGGQLSVKRLDPNNYSEFVKQKIEEHKTDWRLPK